MWRGSSWKYRGRTRLIIIDNICFNYLGHRFEWQLELLPGFNKAGRRRWEANIFAGLKDSGSFLDETPDALVTCVENGLETILYAIEFCSALQAGNQAWQRSGRAFSTGRTGCPYLYIVDFVKYELDARTRERKALRFPNPAVPYSYISFSRESDNFVAQVYVRSEEFDKQFDRSLRNFDEDTSPSPTLASKSKDRSFDSIDSRTGRSNPLNNSRTWSGRFPSTSSLTRGRDNQRTS